MIRPPPLTPPRGSTTITTSPNRAVVAVWIPMVPSAAQSPPAPRRSIIGQSIDGRIGAQSWSNSHPPDQASSAPGRYRLRDQHDVQGTNITCRRRSAYKWSHHSCASTYADNLERPSTSTKAWIRTKNGLPYDYGAVREPPAGTAHGSAAAGAASLKAKPTSSKVRQLQEAFNCPAATARSPDLHTQ